MKQNFAFQMFYLCIIHLLLNILNICSIIEEGRDFTILSFIKNTLNYQANNREKLSQHIFKTQPIIYAKTPLNAVKREVFSRPFL